MVGISVTYIVIEKIVESNRKDILIRNIAHEIEKDQKLLQDTNIDEYDRDAFRNILIKDALF